MSATHQILCRCRIDGRAFVPGDRIDMGAFGPRTLSVALALGLIGPFVDHVRASIPTPPAPSAPTPASPMDPRLAGAAAERQRIDRIVALTLPGYEQLAARARADGTDPNIFAVLQTEAQKARSKARLASLRADEAALPAINPMIGEREYGEAGVAESMIGLHRALNGQTS